MLTLLWMLRSGVMAMLRRVRRVFAATGQAAQHAEACYLKAPADANEATYEALVAEVARAAGPVVLDLTALTAAPIALFVRLQAAWAREVAKRSRPSGTARMRPVAIVLAYDVWLLRSPEVRDLVRRLAVGAVNACTFYAQQLANGQVRTWLQTRNFHHDLPAALAWLRTEWRPTSDQIWAAVLRETAKLVQERATREGVPRLLLQLAKIASSSPTTLAHETALRFSQLSLYWTSDDYRVERSWALRALARGWLAAGNYPVANQLLIQALETAKCLGDHAETTVVLLELGECALRAGDSALAESFLREGLAHARVDDAAGTHARLQRALRRSLADQRKSLAVSEQHARMALFLRISSSELSLQVPEIPKLKRRRR